MRNTQYLTTFKVTLAMLAMMLAVCGSIGLAQAIQPVDGLVEQRNTVLSPSALLADPPLMGEGVISFGPEAF